MSRDHLLELRWKRKMYGHWKQGLVTWEDYKDVISRCRDINHGQSSIKVDAGQGLWETIKRAFLKIH